VQIADQLTLQLFDLLLQKVLLTVCYHLINNLLMKTTAFCFVVIYVMQSPLSTFHLYVVCPAPSIYVIARKFLLYLTVIVFIWHGTFVIC